jgi:catechol 2,3-dioxygenase-like lactoylglutathione lyase family enzyme
MQLGKLDHVNLRTKNLDAMIAWYTTVLGMRIGDRPNFPFPGAWLYVGDQAVVHLIGVDKNPGAGSEGDLKLEHFALTATGMKDFHAALTAAGEKFERREVPGGKIIQYNIWDPDGKHLHIDFLTNEAV